MRHIALGVLALVVAACGPNNRAGGDDAGSGTCSPEGMQRCDGNSFETCTGGQWVVGLDCPIACVDAIGCVACRPGSAVCKNGDVATCDDTGNPGDITTVCPGVQTCQGGICVDACAQAAMNKSYIGCEYWAVDLDNAVEIQDLAVNTFFGCSIDYTGSVTETLMVCYSPDVDGFGDPGAAGLCDPPNNACPTGFACMSESVCAFDAQHSPFAIVVSNPQSEDAHVVVTGANGQTIMQTVASGQVAAIKPQSMGIPDQSVDGTIKAKAAYQVTSDIPIVAYQFNPLDNVNVFSNDASLLLPRTVFDTDYYALSWATLARRPQEHDYHGYISVVAAQDNTQITVTPTVAVQASASQTTIAAGVTTAFTLNAFDVLQLEATTGDLSGTHIVSTNMATFGVFGGHEAAAFGETTPPDAQHTLGPCCADHLEEMVFPSSTWGKTFAIARTQKRTNEPDYIRVMAQKANTSVTFSPAPTMVSGNCAALNPGTYCDVKIQGDTEITASDPVLVGHYMESSIWQDGFGSAVGTGDPSMSIAVPIEQFRSDYTVLIPQAYDANYLSIDAEGAAGVFVDNTAVTLTPFGTHRAARVTVTAGQHTIHCADTCSVLVYGYSDAVSYMFAGGLDLKTIVIE